MEGGGLGVVKKRPRRCCFVVYHEVDMWARSWEVRWGAEVMTHAHANVHWRRREGEILAVGVWHNFTISICRYTTTTTTTGAVYSAGAYSGSAYDQYKGVKVFGK